MEARRERVTTLIEDIEAEGRAQHTSVAGRDKVMGVHPHTRPLKPNRRPRPVCHASTKTARDEYKASYLDFVAKFRAAVSSLRKIGISSEVRFPPYCFVPFLATRV